MVGIITECGSGVYIMWFKVKKMILEIGYS